MQKKKRIGRYPELNTEVEDKKETKRQKTGRSVRKQT